MQDEPREGGWKRKDRAEKETESVWDRIASLRLQQKVSCPLHKSRPRPARETRYIGSIGYRATGTDSRGNCKSVRPTYTITRVSECLRERQRGSELCGVGGEE